MEQYLSVVKCTMHGALKSFEPLTVRSHDHFFETQQDYKKFATVSKDTFKFGWDKIAVALPALANARRKHNQLIRKVDGSVHPNPQLQKKGGIQRNHGTWFQHFCKDFSIFWQNYSFTPISN